MAVGCVRVLEVVTEAVDVGSMIVEGVFMIDGLAWAEELGDVVGVERVEYCDVDCDVSQLGVVYGGDVVE